jgi:hypothetical protein
MYINSEGYEQKIQGGFMYNRWDFHRGFLEDYLNSDLNLGISRNSMGLIAKPSALFFFTGSK